MLLAHVRPTFAPSRSRSERRSRPRQVVRGLTRPYRPPKVMLRGQPMLSRITSQTMHQIHEPQLAILDWEGGREGGREGERQGQLLSYKRLNQHQRLQKQERVAVRGGVSSGSVGDYRLMVSMCPSGLVLTQNSKPKELLLLFLPPRPLGD